MSVERTVVSLCKTQALLLARSLDATCCAIYVSECRLTGVGDRLIPIAIEPEHIVRSNDIQTRDFGRVTERLQGARSSYSTRHDGSSTIDISHPARPEPSASAILPEVAGHDPNAISTAAQSTGRDLVSVVPYDSTCQRDTFPLLQKEDVVGVLVLYRQSLSWSDDERASIAAVVETLECAIELHSQNLALRESLEATYLKDLQRQSHLSDLFHQVRNPLAALHVFGKLLDRRLAGNVPALEIVANIVRESDRLKSLLDDLSVVARQPSLEVAGLQASIEDLEDFGDAFVDAIVDSVEPNVPATPLRSQPLLPASTSEPLREIAVGDLLAPIVSVAEAVAESRDLAFSSHIHCPTAILRTELKLMTEALNNLVDNALKYTPDGGSVCIGATGYGSGRNAGVEISICDTGLGIPPEDLDRVFQRGYRGEKRDTDIHGTGLGLQIVKQIVEQLGADIEIHSEGRGKGVEVRLYLPILADN